MTRNANEMSSTMVALDEHAAMPTSDSRMHDPSTELFEIEKTSVISYSRYAGFDAPIAMRQRFV